MGGARNTHERRQGDAAAVVEVVAVDVVATVGAGAAKTRAAFAAPSKCGEAQEGLTFQISPMISYFGVQNGEFASCGLFAVFLCGGFSVKWFFSAADIKEI